MLNCSCLESYIFFALAENPGTFNNAKLSANRLYSSWVEHSVCLRKKGLESFWNYCSPMKGTRKWNYSIGNLGTRKAVGAALSSHKVQQHLVLPALYCFSTKVGKTVHLRIAKARFPTKRQSLCLRITNKLLTSLPYFLARSAALPSLPTSSFQEPQFDLFSFFQGSNGKSLFIYIVAFYIMETAFHVPITSSHFSLFLSRNRSSTSTIAWKHQYIHVYPPWTSSLPD